MNKQLFAALLVVGLVCLALAQEKSKPERKEADEKEHKKHHEHKHGRHGDKKGNDDKDDQKGHRGAQKEDEEEEEEEDDDDQKAKPAHGARNKRGLTELLHQAEHNFNTDVINTEVHLNNAESDAEADFKTAEGHASDAANAIGGAGQTVMSDISSMFNSLTN